ncbi:Membrane-fusion protein [Sphingopyxis sp. LC81]|uniref:DUF2806 domain-containing protein n=1 Tax=Sphingopyxis sp. LC81 TaxID=1502850 RepID=UPI00050DB7D0|nr:DUF2806 domain-containing protein [Sphingopyxis sp. LC81]KGB51784.1 Membrane-fusion protein [Sphingopyxis sp. LC81]
MAGNGDDKLSREVAIAASLEENGIKLKTKSRAVAALDGLVGAMLDVPTAFLEGIAAKKRVRDSIDEQLRHAQAAAAEEQIAGRPELGGVLIDAVLIDRARKQKNAAGVAIEVVEAMKALPPPGAESDSTEAPSDEREHLDDDWMNMFIRYAEDASSDQLQQLWGRVLAGEIQKVGSFSRQTLRFIAELDKETAENCEWIASFAVGDWIPKYSKWETGDSLLRLVDLQRLGLIEGVGAHGPNRRFPIEDEGYSALFAFGKGLIINGPPGKALETSAILITRLGQEVFSLLPQDTSGKGLRRLADLIDKTDLTRISFGDVRHEGGRWYMASPETLWEA